jgi:vancomycin resistance protein YoaR
VIRGKPGVGVAKKLTVRNIESAAQQSGGARTAALVIGKSEPELTYEEAKALKITRRIGTYTTSVSGTPGRLHNVGLGAAMLNNVLVAPGKVMSVNATTGERTAANGYQVAPVIINGQLEDSLGGGMCQVSTTLFNAAFEAGVQIVERTNHSLYISHYPLGRDATVSYGSYDLKFRNDTKNWILVKSTFTGYSLNFSLYSAPLRRRVTSSVSGWYGFRPFPTVEKKDPTLAKGKKKVETPGVSGQSITCYRKVYDAGGKLLWSDKFVSTYQVVPQVVLVGTKTKPSPSPSGSGTASPKPSPTSTKTP